MSRLFNKSLISPLLGALKSELRNVRGLSASSPALWQRSLGINKSGSVPIFCIKCTQPPITGIGIRFCSYRSLPKKKDEHRNKGPINWKTVGVVLGLGSIILAFTLYIKKEKRELLERDRKRALGKAAIGGKFDLVDHNNQPRKSEDFLGKWLLIYFGFTHCPDICPDEIEKMVKVVNKVDGNSDLPDIQPLFITVDPARDSTDAIKKYLKEFSEKIIGLTGTMEQVAAACKAYRVYFSAGPKDQDDDYIVDHTIIIYLVDPDGEFVDYYGQNRSVDEIVSSITFNHVKYQQTHQQGLFKNLLS